MMNEHTEVKDGRKMVVRMATIEDGAAIAAEHPLPRAADVPENLYRSYYLAKALLYIRTPGAGIMTGWLDGKLAGFIFHCADLDAVQRLMKSPRNLLWLAGQAARGRFSYSPRFWLTAARWGVQHFRQPRDYDDAEADSVELPEIAAWVGTVHTVEVYRRLGVASGLMNYVEQTLAALNCEQLALWVAEDNVGAQKLYVKRGYEQICLIPRLNETCALMVKNLQAAPEVTHLF